MSAVAKWKPALEAFFDGRARSLGGAPSAEDLCYISGRDPRLWLDDALYDDMIDSIVRQAEVDRSSSLLEVGCAAGFVARGLSARVARYTGVDLAKGVLDVARRLELPNAEFKHAQGTVLPFADGTFDAAICYDVYTNFPTFEDGAGIIHEMLRVVRPGGRVLMGSIPDKATSEAYEKRVHAFSAELEAARGPAPARPEPPPRKPGLLSRLLGKGEAVDPQILCYYFEREDFLALGRDAGAETEVHDIHGMNPYHGFRFNVVYRKPAE